jgi:hypothetical protein
VRAETESYCPTYTNAKLHKNLTFSKWLGPIGIFFCTCMEVKMRLFAVMISAFLLFSTGATAACYSSGTDLFGNSSVRCDDGNNYQINRNSLTGTTTMQGYNSRTGSSWSQRNTNTMLGKTQSGRDSNGNSYNCRWNSLMNKWSC